MAHRPRPPLNTIDQAWGDDDTEASSEEPTQADSVPPPPPRRPLVQTGATLRGTPQPAPPDEAPPEGGETEVLLGNELDELVGSSRRIDLNKTSETLQLGSQEMDQLLERDQRSERGGAAPWGGPAPPPTSDEDPTDTGDPFDGMQIPAPPPGSDVDTGELPTAERPFQVAIASEPPPPPPRDPAPQRAPDTSPQAFAPTEAFAAPPAAALPTPHAGLGGDNPPAGFGPAPLEPRSMPAASSPRSRMTLVIIAATAVVVSVTTVLVKRLVYGGKRQQPESSGIVVSVGPPGPSTGPIDEEVREALERLREGLRGCVKGNIGVLPGTSPAVPPTTKALSKNGAYASSPADWKTPVWACTRFQIARPQRFMIQWQQSKLNTEGQGVAWVDGDADGKPDHAFGFRATLKKRGEVEVGEITEMDASTPIALPR